MRVGLKPLPLREGGRPIRVDPRRFVIGRAEDCNLRLDSPLVSRHHCELTVDGRGPIVRDLRSREGVFINGKLMGGARRLKHGDVLRIAARRFVVEVSPRPRAACEAAEFGVESGA